MTRLIPSPNDVLQPLQRLEHAIARLAEQLQPVGSLPSVERELMVVNQTLTAVLDELRGLRGDLAQQQPPVVARKAPPAKRDGRPRARS